MVDASKIPPTSRSFLQEAPAATVNIGLALVSRRSSAIADFWRSCAEVRAPAEFIALQFSYLSQLMDDYQEALNEGVAQLTAAAERPVARAETRPAVRSA